jgi:hypothetical protein
MNKTIRFFYYFLLQLFDPIKTIKGAIGLKKYLFDYLRYKKLLNKKKISLLDAYPQIHDNTKGTCIDSHYFYANGWAMRRILAQNPVRHVDIGSQTMYVNLLSAVIPVEFIDYRPLDVEIEGLTT